MKYLIVGLGNRGREYTDTRHNIGFTVLDRMAEINNVSFEDRRYGEVCEIRHKGRIFSLLKPSTYMNLSGNAVRYWMKKVKVPLENILIIVDDIALPSGSFRMRPGGSDGGHNGLAHINSVLGTDRYARIRIGIGSSYPRGSQVNYVLGRWTQEEKKLIDERISVVIEMIITFATSGIELAMTRFNKTGKDIISEKRQEESAGQTPGVNQDN
jgi:PTH1 family peptidyl-tRNA hydrolase